MAGEGEEVDVNEEEIVNVVKNFGDDNFKQLMMKSRGIEDSKEKISLSQRVINLKREMKQRIDTERYEELVRLKELKEQTT